ncbi:MAG TPA: cytochrome c oxidase accessory protein CcoG [Sphingobacteriaceae bacterium]
MKGKLFAYRNYLSYFLLTLLFAGPVIRINGEQLILLNILERKFVFFGIVFMPQDFYLLVLAMLIFIVFIVLFTVVFGRVWCGWACPQTIFMEMVFRKIEYWIEGDAQKQRKLNASPLTAEKFFKKGLKHTIFLLISFLIANTFLAYIIGSDGLLKIATEPVGNHIIGFISIWLFTLTFYGVFAYVREIVCTHICPYGRLQGVLLDKKSLVVAYDYNRGEPREKIRKGQKTDAGDCIDCGLCVSVCPTGIDIRKGTQLECINCTLCIDACDMVMEKIDRPIRLIGFKSEEQITTGGKFSFSKRIYGYAAVLLVLISALTTMLFSRSDIGTTVLRAGGTLYQMRNDGTVSNLYNAELINKTTKDMTFEIKTTDPSARIEFITKKKNLQKGEAAKLTFFVVQPQSTIKNYKTKIGINVVSDGKVLSETETTFIAPPNL